MLITDFGLAFLEGIALMVSPCILPVLPIILSAGITGDKAKPYGIILGFIIAFNLFTLFSQQLLQYAHIDPNLLRQISFALLIFFGIVLISNYLSKQFSQLTQKLAAAGEKLSANATHKQGFFGGLLLGLPIGLIWTPCAGPILAAVLVQTIRQQTGIGTMITLLGFSIGTGLPMLLLATQGNRLMNKLTFFKKHSELVRKAAGVIIILTVVLTTQTSLFVVSAQAAPQNNAAPLQNTLPQPYPAPEIQGISAWINSSPLTIAQLRGKVVLIDFWTYSCINCVRTLPYINDWDQKYRKQGLVIIGIHSPEFSFEQNLNNVQQAVKDNHITYPVALDNHLDTWSNYSNEYWPAHYLIDKNGNVVYTHFGEGDYAITENNIRALLGQNTLKNLPPEKETMTVLQTPETYLGLLRAERFASALTLIGPYQFPNELPLHAWALQGNWSRSTDKITGEDSGAAIKIHFYAKKVYLVLGPEQNKQVNAQILLNGQPIGVNGGKDVQNSQLIVTKNTLYELVNLPTAQQGYLEIITQQPGLQAYAFTFGN